MYDVPMSSEILGVIDKSLARVISVLCKKPSPLVGGGACKGQEGKEETLLPSQVGNRRHDRALQNQIDYFTS